MEGAAASQYWCHMCSRAVNPVVEPDSIKCSICQSGFVEEMASAAPTAGNGNPLDFDFGGLFDPDRALSLWAPILLGMMANPRGRRRSRHMESEEDENSNANDNDHHRRVNGEEDVNAVMNANDNNHHLRVDGEEDVNANVNANGNMNDINHHRRVDGETELDRGLESMIRRRSSAAILQLLQGIRAGMEPESGDLEARGRDRERDRERMILINPFNQTIIVQGSSDPTSGSQNHAPVGSLGDYFIGPGLDLLMQYLSENDPNRYGTPPAHKEAVEALPSVEVKEPLQCCVCLDDCEIGTEVKQMPCNHKFHDSCILPWLELHSSCPICRYQLPYDEPKLDPQGSRNNEENSNGAAGNGGINRNDTGRQFPVPLPWPLSSLFPTISESSTNAPSTTEREEEDN